MVWYSNSCVFSGLLDRLLLIFFIHSRSPDNYSKELWGSPDFSSSVTSKSMQTTVHFACLFCRFYFEWVNLFSINVHSITDWASNPNDNVKIWLSHYFLGINLSSHHISELVTPSFRLNSATPWKKWIPPLVSGISFFWSLTRAHEN